MVSRAWMQRRALTAELSQEKSDALAILDRLQRAAPVTIATATGKKAADTDNPRGKVYVACIMQFKIFCVLFAYSFVDKSPLAARTSSPKRTLRDARAVKAVAAASRPASVPSARSPTDQDGTIFVLEHISRKLPIFR